MRAAWLLFSLLVATTACSGAPSAAPASASPASLAANATLLHVVDGDTIDVRVQGRRERVRLIGIDTPETKKPNTPVQCFGPEATRFTSTVLPTGTALHLERDVEARDPYDRLLAYVYLTDGTFVNLEIVQLGYAHVLTIAPNTTHSSEFAQAAHDAEAAHAGLWGACTG